MITIRTIFLIVTVQNWFKIRPVIYFCPLGAINFSNVIVLDNLVCQKQRRTAAFLIINKKNWQKMSEL